MVDNTIQFQNCEGLRSLSDRYKTKQFLLGIPKDPDGRSEATSLDLAFHQSLFRDTVELRM